MEPNNPSDKKLATRLAEMMAQLLGLQKQLEALRPPTNMNKLDLMARAIKEHEGWHTNSRSWRNNNPGNLKYTSYTKSLGATSVDSGNFCIFPSEVAGMEALKQFLRDAANNLLRGYKNCTVKTFFETYAPRADNNDSLRYAQIVASKLGVSVETPIKRIISL